MDDKAAKTSALIVASLSAFLVPFMGSSVNLALPAIEREFKIDAVLLSWVATSYLLTAAISLVPFGKLADIYGRKKILLIGTYFFTGTTFFCAVSVSVPMLIVFRILQGAGTAMIFATGLAILTSVFPMEERGKALGITVAAVYIGLTCGPLFGGWITQHFSWRGIFYILVPLGIFVIILVMTKLQGEWAGAEGQKFDLMGSIIYGLAIIAIMYGITVIPSLASIGLIGFGILAMAAFVIWEKRIPYPVFELKLFTTNRVFTFSSLAALVHYSATFGSTFLMSLFLQYIKGLSPQSAGMVLMAQPIMMAIFSPLAGKLSDKIEPRIIATLGMALTTGGLILLTSIGKDTVLWFIIASLMVIGFGFALFSSPNMNAIMSSVDRRYYGIASGSVGTMRLLGQMLSMGIVTLIFALIIGRAEISPQYYPVLVKSVKIAYLIFSTLCGVGIVFSLYRGRLRS
jgi:EmrB/QacA subfamily drug resistance transporter